MFYNYTIYRMVIKNDPSELEDIWQKNVIIWLIHLNIFAKNMWEVLIYAHMLRLVDRPKQAVRR